MRLPISEPLSWNVLKAPSCISESGTALIVKLTARSPPLKFFGRIFIRIAFLPSSVSAVSWPPVAEFRACFLSLGFRSRAKVQLAIQRTWSLRVVVSNKALPVPLSRFTPHICIPDGQPVLSWHSATEAAQRRLSDLPPLIRLAPHFSRRASV